MTFAQKKSHGPPRLRSAHGLGYFILFGVPLSSSGPRANGGVIIEAKIAPKSNTPSTAARFEIHVAFLTYFGD